MHYRDGEQVRLKRGGGGGTGYLGGKTTYWRVLKILLLIKAAVTAQMYSIQYWFMICFYKSFMGHNFVI